MKSFTIAVMLMLAVSAFGVTTEVKNMVKATAKAADATDAALQVLYDLKQANYDAQDQKDAENVTNQENCDNEIADLFNIAEINKASGDATTAHRKYIEKEISDSHDYIDWINKRRVDIAEREIALQDQRCYSAQIFVRSLKENDDALKAIELLRNDLFASIDRKTASNDDFLQLKKDATTKLSAYKHLFDQQALAEFAQLADDEDSDDEHEESEAPAENNVEEQIQALLDRLEQHFEENLRNFEAAEVKQGWDLAVWFQDSEAELEYLAKEEDRTEVYIDKMNIALQAAKATENKAWEIYFQSSSNYHNAITICRHKGEDYLADKHQRQDEIALLDEVISQFKEGVNNLL